MKTIVTRTADHEDKPAFFVEFRPSWWGWLWGEERRVYHVYMAKPRGEPLDTPERRVFYVLTNTGADDHIREALLRHPAESGPIPTAKTVKRLKGK